MIIKTLVENRSIREELGSEHGLSLYIEALGHKILFDTGASDLFLKNAEKMEVDLSQVEFAVISHGHYDHGGGLAKFLEINDQAEVFIHPLAFGNYYARRTGGGLQYIGIDQDLKENRRLVYTTDRFTITKGLRVFSNIDQTEALPASNKDLLEEGADGPVDDLFAHEQNLVIEEGEGMVLLTGCAHNGIVNIVSHFHSIKDRYPDYVIGGFHLSKGGAEHDSLEEIDRVAAFLRDTGSVYYTGHCTGLAPYERLKETLGERIHYLATGTVIEL